jgi:hypothetical protein
MGLLDDAIREHLDLKRRHGAPDEEIAQKEAEALGPARRDFPQPAVEEPAAHPADELIDEPLHPAGDPISDEIEDPPVYEPPVVEEPPVFDMPAAPERTEPPPTPRAELADTEEYRFEDDDDELLPGEDDDDLDDDDDLGELDEDEEEDDEDLLEDTPDFLQDTPEHDRLWFEQKPPRDFDFE